LEPIKEMNKRNVHYFEASTMASLHQKLDSWQEEKQQRLLSISIQREGDQYCCIALSNPMEVVITDASGFQRSNVFDGRLWVKAE